MRLTAGQRLLRWALVLGGVAVVALVAVLRLMLAGGDGAPSDPFESA